MLKKEHLYYFKLLSQQENLTQAISSRSMGDMTEADKVKQRQNIQKFLGKIGLRIDDLVTMEQVHGNRVEIAWINHKGTEIKKVDGLVTQEKNLILAIKTADCLPLVAYDPQEIVLGVAHAGWKGIINNIVCQLVDKLKELGGHVGDIVVGIGPHIGPCCYRINKQRARQFRANFGDLPGMINIRDAAYYLDLSVPLIWQLRTSGIPVKNIEPAGICTACRNDEFFSFRKDGRPFGEFLTVAAIGDNL
ncbi:MAG TPA: peptidoglycan editing factor PgeF [Candidatus Bathyarchaeia archaeon]|nr:peptidoglycan editing factor PgeF [Candidatus Bathyarchaeia archaeon]